MENLPNNNETPGEQNVTNETESLSKMPSFEEHMEEHIKEHTEETERDPSIAEKYYEQAKEYKERWLEEDEKAIKEAEELKIEDVRSIFNVDRYMKTGQKEGFRQLDANNEEDLKGFNKWRENKIKFAKKKFEEEKNDSFYSVDRLARCCKNTEYVKKIADKLQNNEDFNEDELGYLGELPESVEDYFFDDRDYMPIEFFEEIYHIGGLYPAYSYSKLLNEKDQGWQAIIAKARIRELEKQGRLLLDKDEDIQKYLGAMEQNRNTNPFSGETNMDSETGEARTFTPEDNYRRLEGESEEDYAKRLRSITLKTRLAEKRQEQE